MKRVWLALILLAMPLAAQEKKEAAQVQQPTAVRKLFILKYADPRSLHQLLNVFIANFSDNTEMHALAVQADSQTMPAIEDAIARLDVPAAAPKNIELNVYLLLGGDSDGSTVPKELDSVVTQLKSAFAFKAYRLMDTLTLRARTGQRVETSSSGGSVPIGLITQQVVTAFRISSASIGQDGTIRLDGLQSNSRWPLQTGQGENAYRYQDLGLSTDVDIKEGQKVVVGRVGISRDQALFLVLTARVVN